MTKDDLVLLIHERTGFSKVESAEILEEILDLLKERLADGDHVKLSGFGKFQVSQKRARKGRNPITGKEIEISARRVLTFKPSQKLRKALNA